MKTSDKLVLTRKLETAGWSRHDLRRFLSADRKTLIALRDTLRYLSGSHWHRAPTGMTPIVECGFQAHIADTLASAGFVVLGDLLALSPADLAVRKHPKMSKRFASELRTELRRHKLTLSDPRRQVAARLSDLYGSVAAAPISTIISLANLPFGGTRTSDTTINWAKEYLAGKRVLSAADFVERDMFELFDPYKGGTPSEQLRLFGAYNSFLQVRKQIGPIHQEENSRAI